ncbi:T9SS type A sorting domain-containing protein [Roseivirga sp.]|uniref:type IX secretion system anionic LPS delivery protein PorZ n=1 Tax=Roseivirga sp. TaxID=1964215 RepID=UPI002B279CEE|nr:T9SS type A sorting domain-containing protein [Roseivirga sp.]
MIKRLFSLTLGAMMLLAVQTSFAQGQIPVFNWRSHISYNNVIDIAASGELIYAASPNGLFFVDLSENSVNRLTKSNGLSDVSIGAIGYDPNSKALAIGYANGNIDLLLGGGIHNIRTVLEAPTTTNKSFKNIAFNNGKAYLSGDLGIIVLDLTSEEIIESYQNIGVNGESVSVSEIVFSNDRIYAATESGILSASLESGVNRQDYNNWRRDFTGIKFSNIQEVGNRLYASSDTDLFTFDGINWSYQASAEASIKAIISDSDLPLILTNSGISSFNNNQFNRLYSFPKQGVSRNEFLQYQNYWWVGDGFDGLLKVEPDGQQSFKPSGPANDNTWLIGDYEGETIKLSGGFDENFSALNRAPFFSSYSFEEGWKNTAIINSSGDSIKDLVGVESANVAGKPSMILASFTDGLYSFSDGSGRSIKEISPNTTLNESGKITGLAKSENSLWVTDYGTLNSLHEWNFEEDTWRSYSLTNSRSKYPVSLFIAPNGDKWMPIEDSRGGGILVFNETSNTERYLNTNGGQGGLPGSEINALVLDENQFLWVGTDEGIAFFPNLNAILQGQALTASIPIYENRLLLRDENITAVAIDPANRKWFGTNNNGLWLFSETGEELVQRFTTQNSPLISDAITSIYVEEISGEVFVGTDKGLVSFKSDATLGTFEHQNVKIYPNPVPPNFDGQIVINGLVNNASVKITDISGKLIKETNANGSTAIWNGRDNNGVKVKTGVYLVFSSNGDGTETFVGKIVVI